MPLPCHPWLTLYRFLQSPRARGQANVSDLKIPCKSENSAGVAWRGGARKARPPSISIFMNNPRQSVPTYRFRFRVFLDSAVRLFCGLEARVFVVDAIGCICISEAPCARFPRFAKCDAWARYRTRGFAANKTGTFTPNRMSRRRRDQCRRIALSYRANQLEGVTTNMFEVLVISAIISPRE